ncbi:hypothetical protein F4V44_17120 [Niallia endozanthoxylica]|uniref:CBS domain-containing protein n=2 Tax=Niallia endozanthoxylica TaxID=2036016 RepID=A0A5J5HPD0_9BACI|nr:hypothetical protein F4V44_17120 [Niallia endozanthoxylica]
MVKNCDSYESIRKWKEANVNEYAVDTFSLNQFHDLIMNRVFEAAISRLDIGNPPCDFCWFIAGSGGRLEQGFISDQDHGIIFDISSKENEKYFLELGKEISYGLYVVGYPYCKGKIMSSNPMWCKSIDGWLEQLYYWMEERSLESIRYLQIFYDARCLYGKGQFVRQLKAFIFEYQRQNPVLLKRFMENVMRIKNSIGPLGQIITIVYGKYQDCIDLKYSAFLPYVNAIRLLAIKEGLYVTSTLDRIEVLLQRNHYTEDLFSSKAHFQKLLDYRLFIVKGNSYEDTHFLNVRNIGKKDKKELKQILKDGKRLHQYVRGIIEKKIGG